MTLRGKRFSPPPDPRQRALPIPIPERDSLYWERYYWERGHTLVAGLDEAGRGAWAGPVVASAVIFDPHTVIPEIDDSKKLTPKKRDELFEVIRIRARAIGVGIIPVEVIDDINIREASLLAMRRAVAELAVQPSQLLIDGNTGIESPLPQKTLIGGDGLSQSIGAASIIAKVTRDRLMVAMHEQFPQYRFAKHKGYGTKDHQEALRRHGVLDCHRKSFAPVRGLITPSN